MSRVKKHRRTTRKTFEGIGLQEIEPGKYDYWFVSGNCYGILTGCKYFTGTYPKNSDDLKLKFSPKCIKNNKSILLSKRKSGGEGWSYSKIYTINNGKVLFDQEDSSYIKRIVLFKQLYYNL